MKRPKKGDYSLQSPTCLGIATALNRDLVPVTELAENETLPVRLLIQIMLAFREAGLLEGQMGISLAVVLPGPPTGCPSAKSRACSTALSPLLDAFRSQPMVRACVPTRPIAGLGCSRLLLLRGQ